MEQLAFGRSIFCFYTTDAENKLFLSFNLFKSFWDWSRRALVGTAVVIVMLLHVVRKKVLGFLV